MKTLWKLILAFFVLGIGPGDGKGNSGDAGAGDDAAGAGDGAGKAADQDELDLDAGDDAGADAGADAGDNDPVALKAARDAAKQEAADAKADAERHRQALESSRRAPPSSAPLTPDQRLHEQEERDLQDPKIDPNRKWQIEANRTLRANKRASENALFQAHDLADKTSFGQLALTKAAIYKRYSERVEQEIKNMREKGQNAPREAVLRFLIGQDALDGKFAKKAAVKEESKGIDRGKSPGARSDVSARGTLTERQKRAKRLENVQI